MLAAIQILQEEILIFCGLVLFFTRLKAADQSRTKLELPLPAEASNPLSVHRRQV
jgi:hypothetical protein